MDTHLPSRSHARFFFFEKNLNIVIFGRNKQAYVQGIWGRVDRGSRFAGIHKSPPRASLKSFINLSGGFKFTIIPIISHNAGSWVFTTLGRKHPGSVNDRTLSGGNHPKISGYLWGRRSLGMTRGVRDSPITNALQGVRGIKDLDSLTVIKHGTYTREAWMIIKHSTSARPRTNTDNF